MSVRFILIERPPLIDLRFSILFMSWWHRHFAFVGVDLLLG